MRTACMLMFALLLARPASASKATLPGWPPLGIFVLQRSEPLRAREQVVLAIEAGTAGRMDSCEVTVSGRGLSFDGRDLWRRGYSHPDLVRARMIASRVAGVDTFEVAVTAFMRPGWREEYRLVGRLRGVVPFRDTVTCELMVANTVRDGVLWHYGGPDLIQGQCPWGATPPRMALHPFRHAPFKLEIPASVSGPRTSSIEVPLLVLLNDEGKVLEARNTTDQFGAEANRAAREGILGRSFEPVRFEGRCVSAWASAFVTLRSSP